MKKPYTNNRKSVDKFLLCACLLMALFLTACRTCRPADALQTIRERGGCCDTHLKRGMTATAVPILLAGDEVAGSLGCYSPLKNTDRIRQKGLFLLLQEMAARIARAAETR